MANSNSFYTIIDDTDPGMFYTGDWQFLTDPVDPKAPEYNSTTKFANGTAATVSYQFYGEYHSSSHTGKFATLQEGLSNAR